MLSTHNGIISFSRKKPRALIHATTWRDREDTALREISQTQKNTSCMTPLKGAPWSHKLTQAESTKVGSWARGRDGSYF